MTKMELRKAYIAKRKEFSQNEIDTKSRKIADHLISSPFFRHSTFHIYLSIDKLNEINTRFIADKLWQADKIVVVPVMKGKKLISCRYKKASILEINNWGIPEPAKCENVPSSEIDVVLVPMLICDKSGNRIGYGGGYYDRFMAELNKNTLLVGINFFEPAEELPSEEFDVPLNALITPERIIRFK